MTQFVSIFKNFVRNASPVIMNDKFEQETGKYRTQQFLKKYNSRNAVAGYGNRLLIMVKWQFSKLVCLLGRASTITVIVMCSLMGLLIEMFRFQEQLE